MSLPGAAAIVNGIQAYITAIEVEGNNAANAKTAGYKAYGVATTDLFYRELQKSGSFESSDALRKPTGVWVGAGSKVNGTYRIMTPGDIKVTGNPLDIAIRGASGFFAISVPSAVNGRAFTRNGQFQMDPTSRKITTLNGEPLLDDISIPANVESANIKISSDGVVTGTDNNGVEVDIGNIKLWSFPNENGATPTGNSMLVESLGSGDPYELSSLVGKFQNNSIEESNVSTISSLLNLMEYAHNIQHLSKFLSSIRDIGKSINESG